MKASFARLTWTIFVRDMVYFRFTVLFGFYRFSKRDFTFVLRSTSWSCTMRSVLGGVGRCVVRGGCLRREGVVERRESRLLHALLPMGRKREAPVARVTVGDRNSSEFNHGCDKGQKKMIGQRCTISPDLGIHSYIMREKERKHKLILLHGRRGGELSGAS